jgi:hypothetical protein
MKMMKSVLALLFILIFYTSQVLTQDCISPAGPFPNEKRVVIKVNSLFVPDCLTIYDGQSVVWGKFFFLLELLFINSNNFF